ncbi:MULTISPECIES: type II toxin-antitoxin system PemK/MazF family toxin [unclassified Paenibacillus]|uniref:type II toxin-antitoxin system PemK/MazF family toxin n=1 Tax=unclassified Paenibacillus TaxID=185978 RepID=UPI001C102874|nr:MULTISPECIES: type II toxin-antitoxin system PemK/MazF family toxin [unclassified Paenibacillus]MBU5441065.1 type II toxin-antitoxin system PemK/MazF family toxin [Paenibacillus sp. MSJ-34]CAH0117943.1 Endoribonuclease toxin MazF [Paenibacillus sp. CECT 9249]
MTIPTRGDLIWLDFDPQAGHEQAGRRPAVVLSESEFNELTGFAVVCPITSQVKTYPFEVPLPDGSPITGVVLTDQFKSLDVKKRNIKIVGNVGSESEFMKAVLRNTRSILA